MAETENPQGDPILQNLADAEPIEIEKIKLLTQITAGLLAGGALDEEIGFFGAPQTKKEAARTRYRIAFIVNTAEAILESITTLT